MPRAQHVLGSAVLAALLACGGGSDEETLDERVRNVSIAGTVVSDAAFYGDGTIEVRVIPRDVQGKALLVDGMTMAASITSPGGATARVVSSQS